MTATWAPKKDLPMLRRSLPI